MSKKASGLGRGLGDLLEDNAPELRSSTVIRRDENGEVSVSPVAVNRVVIEEDERKPLVFPTATPIIGGESSRSEEEPVDETAEILALDSEISAQSVKIDQEKREAESAEEPQIRSLKAIFRTFK